MTKFGDIIGTEKPVLIDFYEELEIADNPSEILRSVAASLGEKAKVIKIDIKKNEILATKSFFEKTIDNPSSMGIFFIGLVNLAIAAFHIYRQIKVD